jgi:hypothetical protein
MIKMKIKVQTSSASIQTRSFNRTKEVLLGKFSTDLDEKKEQRLKKEE